MFAAFLVASLVACQASDDSDPAAPETPEATETAAQGAEAGSMPDQPIAGATSTPESAHADDSDCGADRVSGRWLNSLPTEDVKADIADRVGDRPIRYYTQGDPITMDFNPSRLNVELGEDGRIKVFRCG
jgi:hypothetical protein